MCCAHTTYFYIFEHLWGNLINFETVIIAIKVDVLGNIVRHFGSPFVFSVVLVVLSFIRIPNEHSAVARINGSHHVCPSQSPDNNPTNNYIDENV